MPTMPKCRVQIGDDTHEIQPKQIDLVRFEQWTGKDSASLGGAQLLFAATWQALLRKLGPEKLNALTFDEFLALEPEVEPLEEDAEGKGGDDEASITASPSSP